MSTNTHRSNKTSTCTAPSTAVFLQQAMSGSLIEALRESLNGLTSEHEIEQVLETFLEHTAKHCKLEDGKDKWQLAVMTLETLFQEQLIPQRLTMKLLERYKYYSGNNSRTCSRSRSIHTNNVTASSTGHRSYAAAAAAAAATTTNWHQQKQQQQHQALVLLQQRAQQEQQLAASYHRHPQQQSLFQSHWGLNGNRHNSNAMSSLLIQQQLVARNLQLAREQQQQRQQQLAARRFSWGTTQAAAATAANTTGTFQTQWYRNQSNNLNSSLSENTYAMRRLDPDGFNARYSSQRLSERDKEETSKTTVNPSESSSSLQEAPKNRKKRPNTTTKATTLEDNESPRKRQALADLKTKRIDQKSSKPNNATKGSGNDKASNTESTDVENAEPKPYNLRPGRKPSPYKQEEKSLVKTKAKESAKKDDEAVVEKTTKKTANKTDKPNKGRDNKAKNADGRASNNHIKDKKKAAPEQQPVVAEEDIPTFAIVRALLNAAVAATSKKPCKTKTALLNAYDAHQEAELAKEKASNACEKARRLLALTEETYQLRQQQAEEAHAVYRKLVQQSYTQPEQDAMNTTK